ncbi:hypothetical protein OAK49_04940 [Euryarchaeota archaeon]|nr:hypothetical protein [Euryarchaeota archaeon]MDC0213105.1 hypothetical protein [Euryarchaeota archaeon]|tara:strand:+ start:13247 stop:14425 length:1179 start_codon:yes stop_codon:yes gene_type:complete
MASGWSRFALRFSEYYQSLGVSDIWTPPRLRSREWMFIPWGSKPPDRHRALPTKGDLLSYLQTRGPHSCFHSTAYYEDPSERKMSDKGWLGADLIFDLDGDHLPGVSDNDFPGMMEKIQEQAWSLWNDFLQPEFGFKEEYVQTTFSGHRGFHIHVRDPAYLHLDSNARRELVNYITGVGIDVKSVMAGPNIGWSERIDLGFEKVVAELLTISSDDQSSNHLAREMDGNLKSRGIPSSTTSIKNLATEASTGGRIDRLREDNSRSVFTTKKLNESFWELVKGAPLAVGETDENVTVDVKRVIRWVGSLHGKSGLRVTEFPLERLEPDKPNSFDALSSTHVFSTQSSIKVELVSDDVTARIANQDVSGSSGDIFHVHEAMATFLSLKGWARTVE